MRIDAVTRRDVMLGTGAAIAVGVSGCLGDDDDTDDNDERSPEDIAVEWVSAADNVDDEDDIEDMTGESEVRIRHGESGDQGNYISEPGIVRIDSGTDVIYEWVSSGHTLTEIEGEGETITGWEDHDSTEGEGFEHTVTFGESGVALWECVPHRAQNHRGGVIVE